MAFAGFNEDTLKELNKAGIEGDDKSKDAVIKDDLPDIDLIDTKDKKPDVKPDVKPEVKEVIEDVKPDVEDTTDKDSTKDTDLTDKDKIVVDTLTEAGFTFEDIQKRIIKDGKISSELEAELKDKIDPTIVDGYITEFNDAKTAAETKAKEDADKAKSDGTDYTEFNKAQKERNDYIYDSVGGEDKFNILSDVLKSKLDAKALKLLNTKLSSEDRTLVEDGMADAVAHYKKITGRGGKLMSGDGTVIKEESLPFMSKSEYKRAVTTDKYANDSEYRNKVDKARITSIQADKKVTMPGQYRNVRDGVMYDL